ncbi:hypothetical protein AB395_00002483 [Sinorhizobium fredii CCBAU 45436]|nr:hypothetical protein AB395_00002483 [Sinorhizobium fredii CCBAU 45436]
MLPQTSPPHLQGFFLDSRENKCQSFRRLSTRPVTSCFAMRQML